MNTSQDYSILQQTEIEQTEIEQTETEQASGASLELSTDNLTNHSTLPIDAVFSNILTPTTPESAEPQEKLPTYAEATLQPSTLLSPTTHTLLIDGIPLGRPLSFLLSLLSVLLFQFLAFLLIYLTMHNHSSRNGAKVGIGLCIIQYALWMSRLGRNDHMWVGLIVVGVLFCGKVIVEHFGVMSLERRLRMAAVYGVEAVESV